MKFSAARAKLPSLASTLLAILSAVLLILAFPGFEFWFLAWVGLIPLFYAVERERESFVRSFFLGWIFGISFFFGTCWWLTYAPVNYGGVPVIIAYLLLLMATLVVGLFPAIFAAVFSLVLKRFGAWGILSAPFLWASTEFLRFYVTGNNWNAIGYSQAFFLNAAQSAVIGGVFLAGFLVTALNAGLTNVLLKQSTKNILALSFIIIVVSSFLFIPLNPYRQNENEVVANVIAIQPNVPMSGLNYEDRERLQDRHVRLSENVLQTIKEQRTKDEGQTVIIFPESPMNFEYTRDHEFQDFLRTFTRKNKVSVLFNSAEPTPDDGLYNSAVLVNERGERIAQYDKIHLVPFGEYAPLPDSLASVVPTMVGSFEFGKSYDLVPLGDAQAGIMICFESHFPTLSREFASRGADVLVELTNDGYLGNTPVLRQHLANAVFRAIETNRPVLRVTNVGITAYIDENGKLYDETRPYTEDTRVWTVRKSSAPPTFYVKYGDWFAWLCSIVSLILLGLSFKRKEQSKIN